VIKNKDDHLRFINEIKDIISPEQLFKEITKYEKLAKLVVLKEQEL